MAMAVKRSAPERKRRVETLSDQSFSRIKTRIVGKSNQSVAVRKNSRADTTVVADPPGVTVTFIIVFVKYEVLS